MKIYLEKKIIKENLKNILRRCGYAEICDRRSEKISYVRRLGNYFYPRFHLYAEQEVDGLTINLHIDQKKPSYKGQIAHSGEYDDELVRKETERIAENIKNQKSNIKYTLRNNFSQEVL